MTTVTFNSLPFAVFLGLTLIAYYCSRVRYRWAVLLLASVLFYIASDLRYLWVLVVLTGTTYVAALGIERAHPARRVWLFAGIFLVVGTIVGFRGVVGMLPNAGIAVPLGLSFFSLRLVSYMLDVFRHVTAAERHAGRFSAYVAFFPELPAGPIDRAGALLPQLCGPRRLWHESVVSGARLFAWGLFKKVVVADRLRLFVDFVYNNPAGSDGVAYCVATLYFAMQIYCDFSGYSDMAIGVGKMLGLRLAQNFNRPYTARTISEFWTRWHISFSGWLRDYVFLPLMYRTHRFLNCRFRENAWQDEVSYAIASLSTMALCGLWHGANWTYLVWGLVMGVFMVCSVLTRKGRSWIGKRVYIGPMRRVRGRVRTAITFFLVCVSWVFFRANSVADAFHILISIPADLLSWAQRLGQVIAKGTARGGGFSLPFLLGQSTFDLGVALSCLLLVVLVERPQRDGSASEALAVGPFWVRWPTYAALILAILTLRVPAATGFIYAGF